MVIANNIMANFTQKELKVQTGKKTKDTEKLSSGYRINRAADDAAGLSISEKMRFQIRGLDQGMENTMDGISFVQTGDGAMSECQDMINRMEELAVQAANGTNSDSDRRAINAEVQELKSEINHIADTTKFNEIYIFDRDGVNFDSLESLGIENAKTIDQVGGVAGEVLNRYVSNLPKEVKSKDVAEKLLDNEKYIGTGEVVYRVRAGKQDVGDPAVDADYEKNGIWLEELKGAVVRDTNGNVIKDANGNPTYDESAGTWEFVDGSLMSWDDVGLGAAAWSGGSDSANMQFTYPESAGGTDATFSFEIDTTKNDLDSVINGLDGVYLVGRDLHTTYDADVSTSSSNIVSADISINKIKNFVTPEEEYKLGRVFDNATDQDVAIGATTMNVTDPANPEAEISMYATGSARAGGTTIDFSGDLNSVKADLENEIEKYYYQAAAKAYGIELASTKRDKLTQLADVPLSVVLDGNNKVTGGGQATHLVDTIKLDTNTYPDLKTTTGSNGYETTIANSLNNKSTLACGKIDFAGINDPKELNGTAFNSTCSTCERRFSAVFIDFTEQPQNALATQNTLTKTLADGTQLNYSIFKFNGNGDQVPFSTSGSGTDNYVLFIDTDSMSSAGYTGNNSDPNKTIARGVVDLFDKVYDFHFTQYASEGTSLYVMEERPGYAQRAKTEAKFEPSFFGGDPSSKNIDFSVNMATNDNSRNMTVDYVYNMANEVKDIMVNLVPNTSETDYYDLRSNGYGTFLEKTRDVEPSDTSTIQNEKQDSFTSGKASGQSQPTSGTTRQLTYTDTEIKTVTTTKTTNFGKRYVSSSNGKEYELKDVKKTVTTVEQHEIKTTYTQNQILDNQGNWVDDPNSARQQQNQVDNIISTQTTEEYVPPKDQWLVPTMTFDGNPVEKLHEFLKEYDEKHDGTPGIIDGKVTKDAADRIVKDVLDHTDVTFDATDYTRLNWECEASFEGDTDAAEPSGYGYTATGEVEWRKGNMEIKIQHSSELSDFTTIPQFALDTKALGLDDADCLTQDNATDLIDRTKYAQEAVSKRRSRYGAIQNRLEHVYRNRGNQMENTQAAESAIRDADIADEMVLFSSHSIMEQAGQSMLAQANQSMQGALSILGA